MVTNSLVVFSCFTGLAAEERKKKLYTNPSVGLPHYTLHLLRECIDESTPREMVCWREWETPGKEKKRITSLFIATDSSDDCWHASPAYTHHQTRHYPQWVPECFLQLWLMSPFRLKFSPSFFFFLIFSRIRMRRFLSSGDHSNQPPFKKNFWMPVLLVHFIFKIYRNFYVSISPRYLFFYRILLIDWRGYCQSKWPPLFLSSR